MLKKIFGSIDNSESDNPPDRAHLQRLIAETALDIPQAEWIALVNANGLWIESFPAKSRVEAGRISAMSAAMSSLGEPIAAELKDGDLQYTLTGDYPHLGIAGLKPPAQFVEVLRTSATSRIYPTFMR